MPSGAPSGDPDASAAIRTPAPAVAPAAKLAAEPTAIPEPVVAPDISREEATSLEVNRIVRGYAESFNALDVGAVAALWLGVDTGELRRVFRSVHSQEMSFRSCDVVSATTSARATCTGSLTYVPKVGSPKPRVQRVRWEFQMQERGGRWLIERLAATPMP